jgi:hypothetical protein
MAEKNQLDYLTDVSQRGIAATKGTGSNQQSNCHKKHKKSLLTYGNLPGAYKRREPVPGKNIILQAERPQRL